MCFSLKAFQPVHFFRSSDIVENMRKTYSRFFESSLTKSTIPDSLTIRFSSNLEGMFITLVFNVFTIQNIKTKFELSDICFALKL